MSVNEISIRTAVAAVRRGSSIRVYMTAVDGGIREAQYEGNWTGGTSRNVIATGKIGTPVAATNIGFDHIRLFYVTPGNTLGEACWDGQGWYTGDLTKKNFAVAPYSGVSAVFIGKGQLVLRVYAQVANNSIQEFCYDGPSSGWVTGANFGPALPGTQIAATSWTDDNIHIRVYAQSPSLDIFEKCWDGSGWYTGGLAFSNKVTRAALGVTSWGAGDTSLGIRLYYGAPGNLIKEKCWDAGGHGWYDGGFTQGSIPASNVAAIPIDVLRVYLQNGTSGTAVTEYAWGSSGWGVGKAALPPA